MALFAVLLSLPLKADASWKRATIVDDKEGSRFFRSVRIEENGIGLAVGYRALGQLPVIFCTNDFGRHWRFAYQRSHLDKPLLSPVDTRGSIAILSSDSFMVLCDNAILLRSSDGGQHWSEHSIDGLPGDLSAAWLKMFNAREGVIVYNRWTVWATSDAGAHWTLRTQAALPEDSTQHSRIRDMHCFDSMHWYVCSDNPDRAQARAMLHETTDGGRTWLRSTGIPSPRVTPYGEWASMMDCLNFVDPLHGWTIASCPLNTVDNRQRDIIMATTDAGQSWTTQLDTTFVSTNAPVAFGLQSIAALNADTVYACGNGKLLCSTNGGHDWTAQIMELNSSTVHVEAHELFVRPWAQVMCTSGLGNPVADLYYLGADNTSAVGEGSTAPNSHPDLFASQSSNTIVASSSILLRSLLGTGTVTLRSLCGQLVYSGEYSDEEISIPCYNLSSGLYTLHLQSSTANASTRHALYRVLVVHD